MNILKELEQETARGIGSVIHEGQNSFKSKLPITPDMAVTYLESQGFEQGDLDTNGWQYDWWLPFTDGKRSFTASGSGYHGGFNFEPTEE